jgi:hypothetical protein
MQIEPQSSVEAPVIKEYREFVDAKVRKYDEITANSSNKRAQRRQKNRFNYKYVQIQQELNELDNAPEIFRVRMGKNVTSSKGGGNIRYNPSTGEIDLNLSDRGDWSTMQKLAHELTHAHQFYEGEMDFFAATGNPGDYYDQSDEVEAFERQELIYFDTKNGSSLETNNIRGWVSETEPYSELKRGPLDVNSRKGVRLNNYKELVNNGIIIISTNAKSKL